MYGCHRCHKISRGSIIVHHNGVAEDQRNSIPLTNGGNTEEKFQASAVIRYLFQVLFQVYLLSKRLVILQLVSERGLTRSAMFRSLAVLN